MMMRDQEPEAKLTMQRIAQELGISRTTVHRVVHGKGHVRPEIEKKVARLVERYGYHPNLAAQNLVSSRASTVGFVSDDMSVSVKNAAARHLVSLLNKRSCRMVLQFFDEANAGEFLRYVQQDIRGRRIDGLIADIDPILWELPELAQLLVSLKQRRFPFVLLGGIRMSEGVPFVSTDRSSGTYKAVQHLIRLGHRRIAFVSNGFGSRSVNLRLRLEGYRQAIQEAGIPEEADLLVAIPGSGFADGYQAGDRIAALRPRPTAVFCINDVLAIGMLRALGKAGVRVPRDVALVGFDDIEAAAYAEVPLTTVAQPVQQIAEEGVRMLFDRIADPTQPVKQLYLEPTLVIRSSCGGEGAP